MQSHYQFYLPSNIVWLGLVANNFYRAKISALMKSDVKRLLKIDHFWLRLWTWHGARHWPLLFLS
jgi:hypothetical protein